MFPKKVRVRSFALKNMLHFLHFLHPILFCG